MNKHYSLLIAMGLICHFEWIGAAIILKFSDNTQIEITDKQFDSLQKFASIFNNYYFGQDVTLNVNHTQQVFNELLDILEQEGMEKTEKKLTKLDANKLSTIEALAQEFKMGGLANMINPLLKKPEKRTRETEEDEPRSPKKSPKIEKKFLDIDVPENQLEKDILLKISKNSGTIKNFYELSGITDITLHDLMSVSLQITKQEFQMLARFAQNIDLTNKESIAKKVKAMAPGETIQLMLIADYLEMEPLLDVAIKSVADLLSQDGFIANLYTNANAWATFASMSSNFPLNLIDAIIQKKISMQTNGPVFQQMVKPVIINPLGTSIYSASGDTISRWNLPNPTNVKNVKRGYRVGSIALSPIGLKLAGSSSNNNLVIYDSQLEEIQKINVPTFTQLSITANNNYMLAISEKICELIQMTVYTLTPIADYRKDDSKKTDCAFLPSYSV